MQCISDRNRQFTIDPGIVSPYTVNWEDDIRTGETLVATEWEVDAGITKVSEGFSAPYSTVWLSGASLGVTYKARCKATYSSGRTEYWTIFITGELN